MLRTVLLLAGCGMLLVGCASQVPIATTYPISTQRKAKASHHWDVLAEDVAQQTLRTLAANESLAGRNVHVLPPPDRTPFNRAFSNFLITRLVNRGMPVSERPDDAVTVQYETQLVRHGSNRYAHLPGSLTVLTAGVWVFRDLAWSSSGALPASLLMAGLADWGMGYLAGGATPTELVVTTSILEDGRYVMRRSDIYYLEDTDLALFVDAKSRNFDVSASERPVKRWEVVGQ
jgi:hypothetical protein